MKDQTKKAKLEQDLKGLFTKLREVDQELIRLEQPTNKAERWNDAKAEAYKQAFGDTGASQKEIDAHLTRLMKEAIDTKFGIEPKAKPKKK